MSVDSSSVIRDNSEPLHYMGCVYKAIHRAESTRLMLVHKTRVFVVISRSRVTVDDYCLQRH